MSERPGPPVRAASALPAAPTVEQILDAPADAMAASRLLGTLREGQLPLSADELRSAPSGDLFGLTQNVGMGWDPERSNGDQYLVLSTLGGVRAEDGQPLALGYHTGHWEVGLLVRRAAETFRDLGAVPFAAACTDPCDGRSQGTTAMYDSLPYRNDAAIVLRRLARSLPLRRGVLGIATCDKGLPAMMQAVAGLGRLPSVIVPGGVTLPAPESEDLAKVQTIGARFAHGMIDLVEAATMGCRACGSAGGGCQFLGTAATSQVVAEALGLALPHAALAPSGEPVWLDLAHRSALALVALAARGTTVRDVLTDAAVRNALVVHAAFGGSTNLLLHVPAVAAAARPGGADRRRLGGRQPGHAPPGRCPAERPPQPPDGAGVHGRRRARGDAPPARRSGCSTSAWPR